MGHLHFNVKDVPAQMKFWTQGLSAKPTKIGPMEVLLIPGTVLFFKQAEATGGTEESVINHVGVKVKDLKDAVAKCQAAGGRVMSDNGKQAMVMGPELVKVELTLDPALTEPVVHHHIHFYNGAVDETKAWYVKMFSAVGGKRGPFEAADLPGVNLTFSKEEKPNAPIKGRAQDHIGFEVKNLEAFCKRLEAQGVKFDVPYRKVPQLGIAVAFFTDPWGTYVELTEGLNKL